MFIYDRCSFTRCRLLRTLETSVYFGVQLGFRTKSHLPLDNCCEIGNYSVVCHIKKQTWSKPCSVIFLMVLNTPQRQLSFTKNVIFQGLIFSPVNVIVAVLKKSIKILTWFWYVRKLFSAAFLSFCGRATTKFSKSQ